MGILHAHRVRLAPALILAVLMALAVIVTLGLAASPASAQPTFEPVCAGCHTQTNTHPTTTHHTGIDCSTCHGANVMDPPPPSACGTCHTPTSGVLAKPTHSGLSLRHDHRLPRRHSHGACDHELQPGFGSGGHHRDRGRH